MARVNQSLVLPGASSKGVGWGRCARVLFNLADRPSFFFYKTQQFILGLLIIFAHCCHQNNGIACPPHSPPVMHPLHASLRCGHLFFGWLLCFGLPIGSQFTPPCILFNYFCIASFDVPNDGIAFPHALHPPRVISPDSLPLLMPTLGWLLCFPFKFRPLKAKAMPITLIFDGVCVGIPNKGTGCGTTKPDHGQLAWDHRRQWHHVLVAPLSNPWRERAKPLGGRAAASHVGCCVFCVVVFCPGLYF